MGILLQRWVFFFEERFICFIDPKDFKDVDWDVFKHIFMQIVSGEAKEVVKATILQLHPTKVNYVLGTQSYNCFTNGCIKHKLTKEIGTDNKELKDLLNRKYVHCRRVQVYNKIKFFLANLICGTNMTGSNSYIQLRSTMQKMKTNPIQGIKNYYWRMIQFQTYLETTWAAMEAIEGTSKTVLFDLKLRENLAGAIFVDQMAKLVKNKHNIWTKPYNKLILELDYYKRALCHAQEEKANLAKILAKCNKGNGKQKSTGKRPHESRYKT